MDTTYKNILPVVTPFSDMANHLQPPHIRSDTKLPVTPHFLLSGHLNFFLPIQNHHIHNHFAHSTQTQGSSQHNS